MPLVLVLTDGEQTVWGGDNAAMEAAQDLKATGVDLVTLSLGAPRSSAPAPCPTSPSAPLRHAGQANEYTMNSMASLPTAVYSRRAETAEALLEEASQPPPQPPPRGDIGTT